MEGATCEQKIEKARYYVSVKDLNTMTTYRVTGQRPRWWYVGVANCRTSINVDYKITFLNTDNSWWKQFGWDEQGMYEMSVVFFLVQFALTVIYIWMLFCTSWEKLQKRVPATFVIASLSEMLALFFLMIHYSIYSWNGIGVIQLQYTYVYLDMFSQMAFMCAIFLLVKGWPNSLYNLTLNQSIGICLFILNILTYILLFTWYTAGWDNLSTLYMYDSIPGYLIIAVRALTFIWCEAELSRTLKYEKEDSKKLFYVIFAFFVAFWFFYLAVNVAVSHFLAAWVRQKAIYAIIFTLNALTFIFPVIMFWPMKSNPFFSMLDISGKGEAYNAKGNNSSNVNNVAIASA
jgi:hypothetical protein